VVLKIDFYNLHYEKFSDGTVKCIEDEIPFDVPNGWCWMRLSNVLSLSSGKSIKIRELNDSDDYPVYGGNGINGTYNDYNVETDTIVIGRVGFYCGSVYKTNSRAWVTDNALIATLKVSNLFNADFLTYMLQYMKLGSTAVSSAQPAVSGRGILPLIIPVPPLIEQRRIVCSYVNILPYIENIENVKRDTKELTSSIKSKILDLAIRGKLVPQNQDDERASVLLERIKAEKEELIKQGKIKRDKKESVIFKGEDNSYYIMFGESKESLDNWGISDLPNKWAVCTLGDICDYGNCIKVNAEKIEENEWVLDLEDIEKDTGMVLKKVKNSERKSTSTKHKFFKGQVLYSKLRPYLNKVVFADDDGYCTSEILPLNLPNDIFPKYVRYYLMSPTFLKYTNKCSYGVKMPRLGTEDGKNAVFMLPPLEEQKRIVDAIETAFEHLDNILNNL